MKKIAILGTRGIPASYSGFETSVEETSIRFVERGYDVTVFCRSNHYAEKPELYKGVKLKYLPSIKSKHLDTVTNSILSIFAVAKEKYDIIIIYGIGNAYFIPFLKLFCKNIISVVDGADWERDKWGKFAKMVLSTGRSFAVKFANNYVVDNELLANNYSERFKKAPVYIPYGANTPTKYNNDIIKKYDLLPNEYIVFIGRYVKEKGIDFLINSFKEIKTTKKLVLIGGNDTDREYENYLKGMKGANIIHLGFVYGDEYEAILKNALFYVSGSFLEGTSPSLLSAMAINGFALVSDIPENVEVLKDSCNTYKVGNKEALIKELTFAFENTSLIEEKRKFTKQIIEKYYTWGKITNQYIELIEKV